MESTTSRPLQTVGTTLEADAEKHKNKTVINFRLFLFPTNCVLVNNMLFLCL